MVWNVTWSGAPSGLSYGIVPPFVSAQPDTNKAPAIETTANKRRRAWTDNKTAPRKRTVAIDANQRPPRQRLLREAIEINENTRTCRLISTRVDEPTVIPLDCQRRQDAGAISARVDADAV